MQWTVDRHEEICGAAHCVIPAGDPIAAFGKGGRIKRCVVHAEAMGYPFDQAAATEVEHERYRLERELHAVEASLAERREVYDAAMAKRLEDRLTEATPKPAPLPPKPARDVLPGLFDPKAAALSDRDR
jgi:hypothetical protein